MRVLWRSIERESWCRVWLTCSIVETLNMKAYVQAIRHAVYVVVDSLLANHRKGRPTSQLRSGPRSFCSVLKDLGADFLNSYVKLVDGEKDPRNLLMLFAMDRVILLEFDVEPMIDVGRSSRTLYKANMDTGLLRHHILLFPDIFQATSQRPLRHNCR